LIDRGRGSFPGLSLKGGDTMEIWRNPYAHVCVWLMVWIVTSGMPW
jgi:hypothetical protein